MTTQPEPTDWGRIDPGSHRDALAYALYAAHWHIRDAGTHALGSLNGGRAMADVLLSPEHAPTVIAALVEAGRLPAERASHGYLAFENRTLWERAETAEAEVKALRARLAAPRHCRACGRDVTVEP